MRIAILGTGRMARARAALLRGHELVMAGSDAARTAAVAADCDARAAGVEEALAAGPDAVLVASATDRHAAHLRAAARLGVPVLCEKPIALTLADTRAAVETLDAAGATVQVGFQRRFDSAFAAAREEVVAGRAGTLYCVRISARDATPPAEHFVPGSGGIFRDMHVHDFDLARWITGREVATAYATGVVRGFEHLARHGDADTTAIVLTMDDGLPVLIDGCRHDPLGYDVRMEIAGSRDVLAVGLGPRTPLHRVGEDPPRRTWDSFAQRFAAAFERETEAFLALVRDGGASPCPPSSALAALRVAVACERSRGRGTPVPLAGGH